MNAKLTLTDGEIERTVVAANAYIEDGYVRVTGLDPHCYPDEFRESIRMFSKNLTAMFPADPDDPQWDEHPAETEISVVSIEPTTEPVPQPDPYY